MNYETHGTMLPLSELEKRFFKITDSSPASMQNMKSHYSTALKVVWFSKLLLIEEAIKLNVYDTEWFSWVDIGINVFREEYPPKEPWPAASKLKSLPKNALIFSPVKAKFAMCFSGTAFLIHKSNFLEIKNKYYEEYSLACKNSLRLEKICIPGTKHCNLICDDDQNLFAYIQRKFPNYFSKIPHNRKEPESDIGPENFACDDHCGWGCAITELYQTPYLCKDKNLCRL
jgi:hypothetical protein